MNEMQAYHDEWMKDPEYAEEWRKIQPVHERANLFIGVRAKAGLTQTELAERMGTKQAAIARLESGTSNPSLTYMQRLAEAAGCELKIEFSPKPAADPQEAPAVKLVASKLHRTVSYASSGTAQKEPVTA